MKELTCGHFGGFLWYRYCFTIKLADDGIVIQVPFRKYVIPFSHIERICSEKTHLRLPWPTERLRIIHSYKGAPKNIYFISTDWNAWLAAFESKGIKIEDPEDIRNANTSFWKWSKRINLFFGYLAIAVALVAVVLFLVVVSRS